MIPFAGHPIVRTGIAAFFTMGFTYATIVAAWQGRWEDVLFLLPLSLMVAFGLRTNVKALLAGRRSRLVAQEPAEQGMLSANVPLTPKKNNSAFPFWPTTRRGVWAARSLIGIAAGTLLTWFLTLGRGELRGLGTLSVVALGMLLAGYAFVRLASGRPRRRSETNDDRKD